ncbi:MAG: response regulator transcription factor [Candidatus Thiodiazotropha sp. (ex Ctena orbiculata)]|uniref:Response regulator transcription factor n=1 Tax=Candidatus Thiodiazotropha taylori TaxID=2792791 RepID=A0A944QWZ8_9GAMM|nr:response regulator transcription factor [Candidatus Thiodiazotropha taylori]PUB86286.1 MAG: DNA-binding response regulator [gamma proteobacterium symbiont of Ctena orbiculata]MBT2990826.1 response regulator transcription factor [Candidatus Thiodiazotropha taylori]MBT2995733.1 response regulator transcription factor [Candidatus Thiodiazotropha taylori]MBT2999312.1 response regulator transcription factor [Candidatus Thiodiazotropha taylori]
MTRKPRILIIEDEQAIRAGLIDVFIYHGFEVDSAAEGPAGLQKALSGRFDMILLDIMLPGINGFDICNRIREEDKDQPIIMLTAKTSDDDIVQGLTLGADDYVAKPFSVAQLVLRVEAVLRRARNSGADQHQIQLGDEVEIDIRNLSGMRQDQPLTFTRREMEIIEYLYHHRERPVPREELLNKVWGYAKNADIETRTVDIHIAKLRRKIEPNSAEPQFLTTVRGAGYRLLVD